MTSVSERFYWRQLSQLYIDWSGCRLSFSTLNTIFVVQRTGLVVVES